ncbi:MAG: ribonuclease HI [Gammaproteobacteria bacterium]
MQEKVTIHTDGACRGNPGPGGWGALLRFGGHKKTMRGASKMTTNNRMELEAAIKALGALRRPCRVVVYTDSQYLKNGVLRWLDNWKENNWRTSDRKPVKNREQWEAIDALRERHKITWRWVKGHSGNAGNEIADGLANRAIDEL